MTSALRVGGEPGVAVETGTPPDTGRSEVGRADWVYWGVLGCTGVCQGVLGILEWTGVCWVYWGLLGSAEV